MTGAPTAAIAFAVGVGREYGNDFHRSIPQTLIQNNKTKQNTQQHNWKHTQKSNSIIIIEYRDSQTNTHTH